MELEQALKRAAEIVENAKLPADLRATAFEKALDSLMGTSSATSGASAGSSKPATPAAPTGSDPISLIAKKLGTGTDVASEVYEVKDGTLDVILGTSRLADGVAAGARQLAVLVAAGRQAAGLESDGWTPTGEIRAICKEFNKFDQANFATTISELDQWFSISGKGVSRKVKMTRAGWEYAAQLVDELTS